MEPTLATKELKNPPSSRSIPWLGGAFLGRSPRREEAPTPYGAKGPFLLLLLSLFMPTTLVLRESLGTWIPIEAGISVIVFSGAWLKRFSGKTLPFFRYAAYAIIALQLTILLLVDALTLISRSH